MRISLALLLLAVFAASPEPPTPASFRFVRSVSMPTRETSASSAIPSANACALLDAEIYAHSNPLVDLRLFSGQQEVPYAITFSNTSDLPDPAHVLNLGLAASNRLSFDLAMPSRPYSSLVLDLSGQDFLASAKISGLQQRGDKRPTLLGTFTLFDLTAQHLGRNTTIQFAESTFPLLHLELAFSPAPGNDALRVTPSILTGAAVPASRIAQTLYTTVAVTSAIAQRPRESIATFTIPADVPVERVLFEVDAADHANFNRVVTLTAKANQPAKNTGEPALPDEQIAGAISRIHLTEAGKEIRQEFLAIPAILGANAQSPATVEIAVQNEDDRPIPIRSVRLQMRERRLCFPHSGTESISLFYGATEVAAPVYDFGRLFNAASVAQPATLGLQQTNPLYKSALEQKSFLDRHPELLWVVLLAVVFVLGALALRSAKRL